MEKIEKLEEEIGLNFNDKELLKTALTHRSYLNEHREVKCSNERMEFLGDAVLQFLSSRFLYEKFPDSPEGDLTNFRAALVCAPSLAKVSIELELGSYLFLSKGEEDSGGRLREYILANTFEALLGAVFLDRGIEACGRIVERYLFPGIDEILKNHTYKDYKSLFQELSQEKYNQTPEYKELSAWGPDHNKTFKMGVYLSAKLFGEGEGSSKQKAEQSAARDALAKLSSL
ncbi:MAG: ribonuclease III [Patescibacteria group bacterium]|nr:ribonuclease III [Patescibacteria group bacterium]